MAPVCGICNRHGDEGGLLCSGCVNFNLLKPKLQLIELAQANKDAAQEVGKVMEECLNRSALEGYVSGKRSAEGTEMNPSSNSKASLSYVLSMVQNDAQRERIGQLKELLKARKKQNDDLHGRLRDSKVRAAKEMARVENQRRLLQNEHIEQLQETLSSTRSLERLATGSQTKLVFSTRVALVSRLICFWDATILPGASVPCVSIMGLPVLPVDNLVKYNMLLVNSSMERLAWFLMLAARYMNVHLPYLIERRTKSMSITCGLKRYHLGLPIVTFKGELVTRLGELSSTQLRDFCWVIAALLVDTVTLLRAVDTQTYQSRLNNANICDLFKMDELVALFLRKMSSLSEQQRLLQEQKKADAARLGLFRRGSSLRKRLQSTHKMRSSSWSSSLTSSWLGKRPAEPVYAPLTNTIKASARSYDSMPYKLLKSERVEMSEEQTSPLVLPTIPLSAVVSGTYTLDEFTLEIYNGFMKRLDFALDSSESSSYHQVAKVRAKVKKKRSDNWEVV